jgi:ribose transport system ATP-binding protein
MDPNRVSLSLKNIVKTYPGVAAVNDVSLDFKEGEVHALMGENGAGKSTLMKIITGGTSPDSGQFVIRGKAFTKITPHASQAHGVQIVHQELNIISALSVTENIFLGQFVGNGFMVDVKTMKRLVTQLLDSLGIEHISPDTLGEDLTVAQMQLVEIAKATSRNVDILVLDEPTSPLTDHETEILFRIIQSLKEKGVTIIYISHRMGEIFKIADRVTVLRDGRKIVTKDIKSTSRDELIKLMVGRALKEAFPAREHKIGETILETESLCGNGLRDINISLRKGEILGIAGLVGSGRTELIRLIYGADKVTSGTIRLNGEVQTIASPSRAVRLGIGLIPEDRKLQGVLLELSVKDNITLPSIKAISRFLVVNSRAEKALAGKQVADLKVKTPSLGQLVRNLSGGNQQKVALGKWMSSSAKILIFDEPTRGIDVGAKNEIYNLMNALTQQGISIIMVSSEMEELIGMSDRIVVLREGRLAGELSSVSAFSQERIMELASVK